jgi:hypothetical protein
VVMGKVQNERAQRDPIYFSNLTFSTNTCGVRPGGE